MRSNLWWELCYYFSFSTVESTYLRKFATSVLQYKSAGASKFLRVPVAIYATCSYFAPFCHNSPAPREITVGWLSNKVIQ